MNAGQSNASIAGPNGRPFRSLQISRAGAVDTVTLNRPQSMNGLTAGMVDELLHYFQTLLFDESVRVVVLTGAGRAFCAGLDIKDFDRKSGDDVESDLALPAKACGNHSGDAPLSAADRCAHQRRRLGGRIRARARLRHPHRRAGRSHERGLHQSWTFRLRCRGQLSAAATGRKLDRVRAHAYGAFHR